MRLRLAALGATLGVVALLPPGGSRPAIERHASPVWCRDYPRTAEEAAVHLPPRHMDARQVLGFEVRSARRALERHGCEVRVFDEPGGLIDLDLNYGRVNLTVDDQVVVHISDG
jgi:hypothetical protein